MATVPTDFSVGDLCVVGIAINGDNGGSTEGGAPGAYVYLYPRVDSVNFRPGDADQIEVDNMSIDEDLQESGLRSYSGSFSFIASYSSQEKALQMIAGGDIFTTGAVVPYAHEMELANQLLFGALKIWGTTQKGTGRLYTFTDVVFKDLEYNVETGGTVTITINWVAKDGSHTPAASPSVTAIEMVRWKNTALTVAGDTWCPRTLSLKIERPVAEDDGGLCSALAGGLASISTNGKRKTTITADIGTDATLIGYSENPDTPIGSTADNSLVFNNGGATTLERELGCVIGTLFPQPVDRNAAKFGKEMNSRAFKVIDSEPFLFTTKNALATIVA